MHGLQSKPRAKFRFQFVKAQKISAAPRILNQVLHKFQSGNPSLSAAALLRSIRHRVHRTYRQIHLRVRHRSAKPRLPFPAKLQSAKCHPLMCQTILKTVFESASKLLHLLPQQNSPQVKNSARNGYSL